MKTLRRKIFTITILMLLISVMIIGCGKNDNSGIDPDSIAFLADYQDIDFGNGYIQAAVTHGEHLYLHTSEWLEEEMRSETKFLKAALAEGTFEELSILALAENEYIQGMAVNEQGNFIIHVVSYSEEGGSTNAIIELTMTGEKIREVDVADKLNLSSDTWLQGMYSDNKNTLYFTTYSDLGTHGLIAMGMDGNIKGRLEYSNWIDGVLCAGDDVYINTWGDMGTVLKKADFASSSFGAEISFSGTARYGNMRFAAGADGELLLSDGTSLYTCDIETNTAEKLLDFIDSDINANDIRNFGQLSNGSYWLLNQIYSYNRTNTELIVLNQTTHGELPKREYLTYAALSLGYDIKGAIIDFNKKNQKYRIIPKEYINWDEDNPWSLAMINFNNDLTSGKGADIIDLSSVNFSLLASKGILYDLNSLISKSDINLDDYLENIMSAYDMNGKKYGIMTGFYVNALVGHASKLGAIDSWTVAEMMAWAENYPDAQLMNTTSGTIMYTMVYSVLDRFIDWETGKCNFTGDEFIKILEFASSFGEEWDWNNPDRIGTYEGLSNGHFLLMDHYVSELSYMQVANTLFDGEEKYIGYPTDSGDGIMFSPTGAAGINAKSKHKDGAFEFISYLISEEMQNPETSNRYAIPIKKSALDKLIEDATKIESDSSHQSWSWMYDDISIDMSQSRNKDFIDTFLDLINRADKLRLYDEELNGIIQEEAESFFAGQKSAKDVADIIQNRVQVYVNENR